MPTYMHTPRRYSTIYYYYVIYYYSIIICYSIKTKNPLYLYRGLVLNVMLGEPVGFRFRVGQCRLRSDWHATGHVSDDRVPLPTAHAKAFAYAFEAGKAHIGPWAHTCCAVDEFWQGYRAAQIAFAFHVHGLASHGTAF